MLERRVATKLLNMINADGICSFAIKYHGTATTLAGIPDVIGAWRGQPFAIEIKTPDEKVRGLSLIQRAWLEKFQRGGYVTGVVTSIQEFRDLFWGLDKN